MFVFIDVIIKNLVMIELISIGEGIFIFIEIILIDKVIILILIEIIIIEIMIIFSFI